MPIRFERFIPAEGRKRFASLIECYQEVFSDVPWNEWKICAKCGKTWGVLQRQDLQKDDFMHCDAEVQPFWPTEKVRSDINKEVAGDASCWIAIDFSMVIGFCWGYPMSPDALENKLALAGTAKAIACRFGPQPKVAYQDEIGVRKNYRNQGIAKRMFRERHADFSAKNLNIGVVRTKDDPSSVTHSWYKKLGYEIINRHPDADTKLVIMARPLEGI